MEEIKSPWYIDCDGLLVPAAFSPDIVRSAMNYKHKPGQIYLVCYPKCGSTWMQHIVSLILRKGEPLKDGEDYVKNSPQLEMSGIDAVEGMDGPGIIKSHLPFNRLRTSPDAKYIYITRNPKDNCVSFYYHTKKMYFYNFQNGAFDEFFDIFINDKMEFGDFFDHLLSWYEHKDDPNVHFLIYENLKYNTKEEILKVAKFLGEKYHKDITNDPKYMENVLYYSSFEYMKGKVNDDIEFLIKQEYDPERDSSLSSGIKYLFEFKAKYFPKVITSDIKFVRKGIVGDWKNHFSPEQEQEMEQWIKRKTEGSDVMNLWKDIPNSR